MTEPALRIENLHYRYREDWSRKTKHALKGISLEVREGESFGFLGHNGAGKTTTIKAILDLIRPSQGSVQIFGRKASEVAARSSLGFVPEQPYFYDHLSVQEVLRLYGALSGIPQSRLNSAISEVLAMLHLEDRRRSPLRALSKGLLQRVALAQAIIAKPKILILDEPFSGLDPLGRREFRDIFSDLKGQGCTIFMSSHILSDVEFLCDRASILAHGELKGIYDLKNPPPELSSSRYELVLRSPGKFAEKLQGLRFELKTEEHFTRLRFYERASAERALSHAITEKIEVQSFELVHDSLEDVFVRIVTNSAAPAAPRSAIQGDSQK